MMISVIIPTYNNFDLLKKTLFALHKSLDVARKIIDIEWEVIISDDGSKNNLTNWFLNEYPNVKYFWHRNLGRGTNRNYGAEKAKGKIYIMIDDDIELEEQSLVELISPVLNNYTDINFGYLKLKPSEQQTPLENYLTKKWEKHMERYNRFLNPYDSYSALFAIRKSTFESIGGFSGEFKQYGGEDTDIFVRLSKQGAKFGFSKDAIGWHHQALDLVSNLRRTYLSKYSASLIPGFKLDTEFDHSAFNKTIKNQILYFIIHHNLWSKLKPLHYFLNKLKPKNKLARYFYHYLFLEYAKRGYREGVLKKWL